jgi:hypothetical protein
MYDHISHNGHGIVREEKITFRGLEPTTCTATNENQQTLSTHTSLQKKDARQAYVKQIKGTPSIACEICVEGKSPCGQVDLLLRARLLTLKIESAYHGH